MATYVDALAVMRAWINGRTTTLVGVGHPLQLGAHLKHVQGAGEKAYAFLEEQVSLRSDDAAEDPDMLAQMSAQVYGGTREAAATAATALAEELSSQLNGRPAVMALGTIFAVDDLQGPQWQPDGTMPRYLLGFTVRLRPA
jgi:ABC-type uncharacterized transport system substrate-binding protein